MTTTQIPRIETKPLRARRWRRWEQTCCVGLLLGAGACASEVGPETAQKDLTQTSSALRTSLGTWTDWSGYFQTQLWVCDWSAPSARPEASCSVPGDYLLVGGGAEIDTAGTQQASVLTGSYPDEYLLAWHAESRQHLTADPHRVRAYAFGLKVASVTAADLATWRNVVKVTSDVTAHPTAIATVPDGYFMVGGGAQALSSGEGQLLYDSHPSSANSWYAASRDHVVADPGTVTAYAIGLAKCYPFCQQNAGYKQTNRAFSGYAGVATNFSPNTYSSFAVTSIGGVATNLYAGRLLVALRPDQYRSDVWSKDQWIPDDGTTEIHVLGVRMAGTAFFSGNPVQPPPTYWDYSNWTWFGSPMHY